MDPIQPVNDMNTNLERYLNSLTEKEMKSYLIAKDHLGSSFDLSKSVGFINWKKDQEH
jgi:hypothetical protein